MTEKSAVAAFLLSFFLGPIGLMYVSIGWGLALLAAAIITAPTGIGPIVIMLGCMIAAPCMASAHNARVRRRWEALLAGRHEPSLSA